MKISVIEIVLTCTLVSLPFWKLCLFWVNRSILNYAPLSIQLKNWRHDLVWRDAGKSLARTGRKQATETKLGNYSVYSQRSSIDFLALWYNFWKPLIKIRKFVRPTGLHSSNDLRIGRKMATFQLIFQSREQVVVRRSLIRRIGWMMTLEAQVGQFLVGCKCPVSHGIVVQEQDPLGDLSAALAFFPTECPSVAPAEMSNTRRW